jgi:hypothetical protein
MKATTFFFFPKKNVNETRQLIPGMGDAIKQV